MRCDWRWHATTWGQAAGLCRADALAPVTRDAVRRRRPRASQRRAAALQSAGLSASAGGVDGALSRPGSGRKVFPRNRFRPAGQTGIRRRNRGDVVSRFRPGSVPVVSGAGRAGCAPSSQHPGQRRADHRRRAGRLPGAIRRAMDRRPRRRRGPRGSGPPLRRAARTMAARPRNRLPVRGPAAVGGAGLRGARTAGFRRAPAAAGTVQCWTAVRSRSWSAVCRWTPTRCGGGCGCAVAGPCPR